MRVEVTKGIRQYCRETKGCGWLCGIGQSEPEIERDGGRGRERETGAKEGKNMDNE